MTDIDKQYRKLAGTQLPNSDDYDIRDDAAVSKGEYGAWVQCWVYVRDYNLPKALLSECDHCGDLTATHKLEPVRDPGLRLDSGGIVPNGHCPECGALCYPVA